ncbi:MAG: MCE family protein [Actinobacteria bacterium]|nr:MCE family protein [Actinomycetota bacterium]MBO0830744.1 MCE family protein [Actinomycetota bacterium]MBO0833977.1 MCE family protein [Actinomycetota bacterium]
MLTITTRLKVLMFAVVAVVVLAYTGLHYAKVGRYVGLPGYYVVDVNMPQAGGIYPNANVTYRGVSVGRVGAVRLYRSGIQVQLDINNSAPQIPADTEAVVSNLSAVGETYLDLRPRASAGPYLTSNSVIRAANTQVPPPVTDLLSAADSLARSLPGPQLRTLVNELYYAFNGQGPNLQLLLDSASSFTQAAAANLTPSTSLIQSSATVLATQEQETAQIETFASEMNLFARQLADSNSSLRGLISAAPQAATQVTGLLKDNAPDLGLMLANLLTAANITLPRHANLQELLSALPAVIAAGNTAINSHGANFGMALTFFDPLPCTSGYQGTQYRNGLVTTAPKVAFNTGANCTEPVTQGNVRGSQHAP